MLSRLETTYLGILRVIILIVATLALLLALGAFISALPALMRQIGVTHGDPAVGGTLQEYIDQRSATGPKAGQPGSSLQPIATGRNIDPSLSAIANNIADYLSKNLSGSQRVNVPALEDSIVAASRDIPQADRSAYYHDAEQLSAQLKISAGERLTPEQVSDLFSWHEQKFVTNLTAAEAKRASETGSSLLKLYVAGYSFTAFILVVFTFLFVKIERSLRIVRVEEVDHA